jgi:PAS domain S-box-containing protein
VNREKADTTQLRVLCLEDSPADAELERELLIAAGHDVDWTTATTRDEFAAALQCVEHDVILADNSLPGFDALAALELAFERRPDTPFICVSGTIGEELTVELLRRGADDVVVKDRPARLPLAVDHALAARAERGARRRAEAARAQIEQRFADLFARSHSAIVIYEAVDDGRDFVIKAMNPASATLEHVDVGDVVGRRVTEVFPGVEEFGLLDVFRHVWRSGEPEEHGMSHYTDGRIEGWRENTVFALDAREIVAVYDDVSDRVSAELALRESERLHRSVLENAGINVGFWDLDGRLLYCNPLWASQNDLRPEDYIGRLVTDIFGDEESSIYLDHMREVTADGRAREYEEVTTLRRGKTWFLSIYTPVIDDDGTTIGVQVFSHDISARKQAESALAESELKYRELFDAESDAILLIDNETGRILEANPAAETMYGFTRDELLETVNRDLSAEPEETQAITRGTPVVADQVVTIPMRLHRKKDGTVFPVEITGRFFTRHDRPVHIAAIRDITLRTQTEDALRESERRLSAVLETMSLLGLMMDDRGRVAFCNDVLVGVTGWTRDELMGQNWFDLCVPDDAREEARSAFLGAMAGGDVAIHYENDIVTRGGERRLVSWNNTVLMDADGRITGAASIGEDITERRSAETALRQSEEKFAKAFHGLPDAILVTRVADGLVIEVNDGFCEMSGFDRSEAVGRTTSDLEVWASPDDRERWVAALKDGRITHGLEFDFRVKSGEVRRGVYSGAFVEMAGEPHVLTIVRDVTDQRRAEDALREKGEELERQHVLLETLLDTIPSPVFYKNVDGAYIGCNRAFERFVGRQRDEIVGRSTADLAPAGIAEKYDEMDRRLLESPGTQTYDWVIESADGSRRDVVFNKATFTGPDGDLAGIVGVILDITERHAAEMALRQSEERLRTILEHGGIGVAQYSLDGRVLLLNQQAVRNLGGGTADDFVGKSLVDLFGTELGTAFIDRIGEAAASPEPVKTLDKVDMPHGTRWFSSVHTRSLDAAGDVIGVHVYAHDVTELMRAEEEVRLLNVDLERRVAQRTDELRRVVEELESFAYSISHDLRAPLRAIDGFSQILLSDHAAALDDEGRAYFERIRNAATRMSSMVDGLLALSRLNRGDMQRRTVDLSMMAVEIAEDLTDADPGRQVKVTVAQELRANADPGMVRVVLANLIGNAWKFTSRRPTARIDVGAVESDGERAFFVRDDGAGFDMTYADKLFGPFQRMHSVDEFEGTGIGLASVARIVQRHGGRVWAESRIDEGSTFWFTLPDPPDRDDSPDHVDPPDETSAFDRVDH